MTGSFVSAVVSSFTIVLCQAYLPAIAHQNSHPVKDHQLTLAHDAVANKFSTVISFLSISYICTFSLTLFSSPFSALFSVCCCKLISLASLQPIWQQWPSLPSPPIDVHLRLTKIPHGRAAAHQCRQLQLPELTTNVSFHQNWEHECNENCYSGVIANLRMEWQKANGEWAIDKCHLQNGHILAIFSYTFFLSISLFAVILNDA